MSPLKNLSLTDSISNSSKMTELVPDPPTDQENQRVGVDEEDQGQDRGQMKEVQVQVNPIDKIPFSFPNLTDTGDKKFNLLVVGPQIPEILQGLRKQADDDEKCRGVFSIFTERTLVSGRPFVQFNGQEPIHFVMIIMKASDPTSLSQAARELSCIDAAFLARKRVVFCMSKQTDFRGYQRGTNNSQIEVNELKAFCNTVGTMVHSIYFDQSESVAFGTKLIYNKIKRLLSHPC